MSPMYNPPRQDDKILENQQYFQLSFTKAKPGQLTTFITIISEPLTVWHVSGQTVDRKWLQTAAITRFVSLEKGSLQ